MSRLDEILDKYVEGVPSSSYLGLTDEEAKEKVIQLFLDLVGEDESQNTDVGKSKQSYTNGRNALRSSIRKKIENL